jgi:regulator of replication initiation timing
MAQSEQNYNQDAFSDIAVRLRDIEDKQNLIKDRVLLIGDNLVSEKEENEKELMNLKMQISFITEEIKRLKMTLQRMIDENQQLTRKNEFEILKRQFEMFQPLELARIEDVKDIVRQEMKKALGGMKRE